MKPWEIIVGIGVVIGIIASIITIINKINNQKREIMIIIRVVEAIIKFIIVASIISLVFIIPFIIFYLAEREWSSLSFFEVLSFLFAIYLLISFVILAFLFGNPKNISKGIDKLMNWIGKNLPY
jgi:hypothetical protein